MLTALEMGLYPCRRLLVVSYSSLKPSRYIPRLVDGLVEKGLAEFGGVEVCGPRWSGKSWTAQALGESLTRADEIADLLENDPSIALRGAKPHIIDEWQDVPAIWNAVRHRIDDEANVPGQYILTGSSAPIESKEDAKRRHSGAGRIARVRMSTMTLAETGESNASVSLAGLFRGEFEPVDSQVGLVELAQIVCRGGWPAIQSRPKTSLSRVVSGYLDSLFNVSMANAGKNPILARRIAQSLARNVATSAKLSTLAEDAAQGEAAPAEQTVRSYLDEFARNYFVDELPGWDAPVRAKSRLRTKPKRYFADPSLAANLLGVDADRLLTDGQLFGLLFESLCIHDLAVYAAMLPDVMPDSMRYYADADGLEVDVVIELADGRWAGIEIKAGEEKVSEAVSNLKRLKAKVAANPAARNPEPAFLAVLLGKCAAARFVEDEGVYVFPVTALGA